jgi:glycosyltransferase involved in cell wall biosynthesis
VSRRIIWHIPEPSSAAARYPREMIHAVTAENVAVDLVCPQDYRYREELSRNPLVTLHLTRRRSVDIRRGTFKKIWTDASFLFSSMRVLFRTCRKGAVVHFQHTLHFPFAALFFACARWRGSTIVFTVHDPVPHRWFLPRWLGWIEKGALRWAYRVSDTLIVHSEPGKQALTRYFAADEHKIAVIARGPYGLDAGLIAMPESERLEILLFGSIRENKGVHLAIEAVQDLHRRDARVRLTIAGEVANQNETGYWQRCREWIARFPEPILVRNEFVPDERLAELIAACHCFLLPYTTFFSDSGVAFLALANGRPIVSTRAGGLGPLLDATGAGVEIGGDTAADVREAIAMAYALTASELASMGERGASYVNQHLAWRNAARRTIEIYRRYFPDLADRHGAELEPHAD